MQNLPAIVVKADGSYPIAVIENAYGEERALVTQGELLATQTRLDAIATAAKKLSEEKRDAIKAYQAAGGGKWPLNVSRALRKMDPDDRREAVDELLALLIALKYS